GLLQEPDDLRFRKPLLHVRLPLRKRTLLASQWTGLLGAGHTVGATYKLGASKLYASYIYSNVYPAGYRNDSFSVAVSYPLTPALELKLPVYVDRLKHAGQSGTRITGGPLLDYSLSKRTDVYAGVDYTRLNGAWQTLAGTSGFTLPVSGRNSVFEATVGLRHKF
ncbi:porin, partial [Ralstonia pseudosolanacearum]|uniref:porin n=1 Tax=Ralstonia pseudosolanacearum TaxID=1310165 RepID=UPI001E627390